MKNFRKKAFHLLALLFILQAQAVLAATVDTVDTYSEAMKKTLKP